MGEGIERIDSARTLLWIWSWFSIAFALLWFWWALTASTYRYEVAQNTGILTNERWSVDFVLTAGLLFQLLAPLTLSYAIDSPLRSWRRTLHLVLVIILFVCGIVTMSIWADYYHRANDATASNARNPANDPRWCNLYYAIPGSGCLQTSPTPGLIASMLSVASPFLWKFWFLIIWLILLIADFFIVMLILRSAVNDYLQEKDPLLPEKDYEEKDEEKGEGGPSQSQSVRLGGFVQGRLRAYKSFLNK